MDGCAAGRTRTCNLLFRRQLLCPLSYRGVVGRRIPEPGQARDCQERPSTAAPLTTVVGPVGRPAGEVDGGQGAGGGGVDEAAGGHGHAVDGGPVAGVGGAAGDEGVGAEGAALGGEPAVVEAGVGAQGVVERPFQKNMPVMRLTGSWVLVRPLRA